MTQQENAMGLNGAELIRNREAISRLAQSQDAQRLMELLSQGGGVQDAAQAAANGSPDALVEKVRKLMSTQEGAGLVERICQQAKQSGLTQ